MEAESAALSVFDGLFGLIGGDRGHSIAKRLRINRKSPIYGFKGI